MPKTQFLPYPPQSLSAVNSNLSITSIFETPDSHHRNPMHVVLRSTPLHMQPTKDLVVPTAPCEPVGAPPQRVPWFRRWARNFQSPAPPPGSTCSTNSASSIIAPVTSLEPFAPGAGSMAGPLAAGGRVGGTIYPPADASAPTVKSTEKEPIFTHCYQCEKKVTSAIRYQNGRKVGMTALILGIACLPLIWVPFVNKSFKDEIHYCETCKTELGRIPA
ncbi:hypothetical protein IWQ60_006598 [Tieghemiomyces parasiticus]|uniref:LITAF domain-containing protein n=1 Tax=Tieghemiomyces parasiticus TaxID=78921 RepID=A0A9W8DXL7_9FUNG|nr:hypothetical protein IWQ60_006598 [Tieghemiomyces parasiticus]